MPSQDDRAGQQALTEDIDRARQTLPNCGPVEHHMGQRKCPERGFPPPCVPLEAQSRYGGHFSALVRLHLVSPLLFFRSFLAGSPADTATGAALGLPPPVAIASSFGRRSTSPHRVAVEGPRADHRRAGWPVEPEAPSRAGHHWQRSAAKQSKLRTRARGL